MKKDLRHREGVRATIKALGCREDDHSILAALECVITSHLRQIKSAVIDWCINEHPANFRTDAPDWASLQLETQIAVPAMWDAAARGVMATAARDAGLGHVNFREEPQCVAGSAMSWLLHRNWINADDNVLFFDVGAGTTDEAMVRFRHASTQASQMVLERVGPSHGCQGGSLVVNDHAWESFKNHVDIRAHGGLAAFCRRLKIPEAECQRQVHEGTEVIKERFDPDSDRIYNIPIYGLPTQHVTNAKPENIMFSRFEVELWYDKWANVNENLLREIILKSPRCHRAVLTGGGMKSRYLQQRLKATLGNFGIESYKVSVESPCSRGALNHYWFQPDDSIRDATFFVTRGEDFDRDVHDASHAESYRFNKKGKVVNNCLAPIMQVVNHEEVASDRIFMDFDIDSAVPSRLHFGIYCSTNPGRCEFYGPPTDASGNLLPDLIEYPKVFFDLPDLASYNFRPKKCRGKSYYEVPGEVEMHKRNGSYELSLRVFGRNYQWARDQNSKNLAPYGCTIYIC